MSKQKNVLYVQNLSKTFVIREKAKRSIKDAILKFYQQKGDLREIKALQNLNFEVNQGEFFGIIGRNGSGKSTLLRLIMGSFKADTGSVIKSEGKIIRLALGLGFDMNLSARDNIYVNASVLGISFKKIGSIFHEIIEFAELENFIDTPIKHYSSGMIAKLKFSIAKYAEADILLIDEIFGGVGDIAFQHKSQKVFKEKIITGKTIILVSHNLQIIAEHCSRVLLLDRGKQVAIGTPAEIIPIYEKLFEDVIKEKQEYRDSIRKERERIRKIEREKRLALKTKEIEKERVEKEIRRQKIVKERQYINEQNRKSFAEKQHQLQQRWKKRVENLIIEKKRILSEYTKVKKDLASLRKENERLKSSGKTP